MLCCALILSLLAQPLALIGALRTRLGNTFVLRARSLVSLALAGELLFLSLAGTALAGGVLHHWVRIESVAHLCGIARSGFLESH